MHIKIQNVCTRTYGDTSTPTSYDHSLTEFTAIIKLLQDMLDMEKHNINKEIREGKLPLIRKLW